MEKLRIYAKALELVANIRFYKKSPTTVALLQVITLVYKIETSSLQSGFKVLGKQINAFSKNLITEL